MNKNNIFKRILSAAGALIITASIVFSTTSTVRAEDYWPTDISVLSEAAIVMEYETGTILYEKNIDEELFPASITKILTCILAVENCELDEIVTFSKEAVARNETNGASHIARDVGEQMTLEQCIYATMVASANECAWAVAEHVAGDIESFADLMNAKVKELGCTHTHFSNPNGLHSPDHYTSAHDMALIARYAYSNEKFRTMFGTKRYVIPPTNKHKEETPMSNHHGLFNNYRSNQYIYPYAVAGKTGFTTEAGSTLVTIAKKEDVTLICVVLKNPGNYMHYQDTINLFDFAFDNFTTYKIAENYSLRSDTAGSNGSLADSIDLIRIDETGIVVIPRTASFTELKPQIISEYNEESQSIGEVAFSYASRQVGSAKIFFASSKTDEYPFDNLKSEADQTVAYYYPVLWPFFAGLAGVALIVGIIIFIRSKAIDFRVFKYRNFTQKRRPHTHFATIKRRNRRYR